DDAALRGAVPGRTLRVTAELVEAMGSDVLVHFRIAAPVIHTDDDIDLAPVAPTTMVARVDAHSTVKEGDPIELLADTDRLHLFDPESGQALGAVTLSATRRRHVHDQRSHLTPAGLGRRCRGARSFDGAGGGRVRLQQLVGEPW